MHKYSLRWRIILPIGILIILGIAAIDAVITVNYTRTATNMAIDNIKAISAGYGSKIETELESSFGCVKTLAAVLESAAGTPEAVRDRYNEMMSRILQENEALFGIWTVFEPGMFDGKDQEYVKAAPFNDETGRYIPYIFKDGNGGIGKEFLVGYETPGDGDYYLLAKNSGKESITPPFDYKLGDRTIFVTSVAVPISRDNRVIGVAGGDVLIDPINEYMAGLKVFDSGYAMLVDQSGNLIYHPKRGNWSKSIYPIINKALGDAIKSCLMDGEPRTLSAKSVRTGSTSRYAVHPFLMANTGNNWAVVLVAPENEIMAPVNRGIRIILATGIVMLVLCLLALYFMVSRTSRELMDINEGTTAAAKEVYNEAGTISDASSSLADGANSQAASLEEISSALEEMSSMTKQNADNASKTRDTMDANSKSIARGATSIGSMSQAMSEIEDSAGKIGAIIKTIEDIAFQTNLLALNAAVEAARAGEAGKGFAVVADEVRNLAQRSAQSANETTSLIQNTIERVKNGAGIAQELSDCFVDIESGAGKVHKLIGEIATASNEQAVGVDQINTAVAQLDSTTQQAAANSQNTAHAASDLNEQSNKLNDMVHRMAVLITGDASLKKIGSEPRKKKRFRLSFRKKSKQLGYTKR